MSRHLPTSTFAAVNAANVMLNAEARNLFVETSEKNVEETGLMP
jgi:hypothetical protein